MNTYYVYILHCSDNTYYTGITNHLERRVNEHNTSMNITSYTYSRRPASLVFYERFTEVEKAIQFEKKIKKWSQKKKEALIEENFHLLPGLSKKKNFSKNKNTDLIRALNEFYSK